MIAALESHDLHGAQRLFLDGDRFRAGCAERFRGGGGSDFGRKLANSMRRFARFFEVCQRRLDGDIKVIRRTGGYKKRQMRGCGEGIWEYADLDLEVEARGRKLTLSIDGIVGIDGRYYVAERVRCR